MATCIGRELAHHGVDDSIVGLETVTVCGRQIEVATDTAFQFIFEAARERVYCRQLSIDAVEY